MACTANPPCYADSSAVPSYSSRPRPDEHTLEFNARSGAARRPLGTIVRKWKPLTIVLKRQAESEDGIPTYGRNEYVDGEIDLVSSDNVVSVSVKLEGRLLVGMSDNGTTTSSLLSEVQSLWQSSEAESMKQCPTIMPFTIQFPSTFTDNLGRSRKLPPSCDLEYPGIPILRVRCIYQLIVTVRQRGSKFSFWKLPKSYSVALNYSPRSRPPIPVNALDRLFSSLKPQPEAWRQIALTLQRRPKSTVQPLDCHFLIPSVLTFALSDTIPFHIQLSGPLSSLQHFFGTAGTEPTIKVSLSRQIVIELDGRKAWRSLPLGHGIIRSVPPHLSSSIDLPHSVISVDWEGEICCDKSAADHGGFNVGCVSVKDFLVIEMTPPKPHVSPLLTLIHAHPIKLVTDTWLDETFHPLDV